MTREEREHWYNLLAQNRCRCYNGWDGKSQISCPHEVEKFSEGDLVRVINPEPYEAPDEYYNMIGRIDCYTWDCGRHYVHVYFAGEEPELFAEWELELVYEK